MHIRSLLTCGLVSTLLLGASSCNSGENLDDDRPKKKKKRPLPKDPVLESANHLLISEIVPHTEHDLKDADGEAADWIELHNNGAEAIALGAFALTDDEKEPLKWQLPERSLEPNEFVIVFASGKDRTEAGSALHANFKLDGDGEYLALVRIEDERAVHTFAPVFPKVPKGKSYGYEFENGTIQTDKFRIFETPSPGQPNADAPPEPEEPLESPENANLNAGDNLKVTYRSAAELNLTQKVRPDGSVHLPIIGEIRAANKKRGTFQEELCEAYRNHLQDPTVTVSLVSVPPGEDRPRTALEAAMEAGTMDPAATQGDPKQR